MVLPVRDTAAVHAFVVALHSEFDVLALYYWVALEIPWILLRTALANLAKPRSKQVRLATATPSTRWALP